MTLARARTALRFSGLPRPSLSNSTFLTKPAFPLVSSRNMSDKTSPLTDNANLNHSKLFDCSHVTALVTGGGSGIGLMCTQALVANGAKVYITGRTEEKLDKVVEKYNTGPGKIIGGDVSSKEDAIRLADEIKSREPNGITLLVNNAGVALDNATRFSQNPPPDMEDAEAISKHFLASEQQAWNDTFRVNVTGGFWMSMAFLPLLAKGQESLIQSGYTSSVVNVSSISGAMKGSSGGQFAYATSKAAFTHLTRMLATTFAKTKVRVNCIAPGVFPSEMTAGGKSDGDQKSVIDKSSSNPAGRKGHETDMAATILFLAGRGGTFYNHQILYPDGGNTLTEPATN